MSKNYQDFGADDFLRDEFFVEWVVNPDDELDHFWGSWLVQHPEKRQAVELAREIVKSMRYEHPHRLSDEGYAALMERIFRSHEAVRFGARMPWWRAGAAKVAASIALLMGVLYIAYFFLGAPTQDTGGQEVWLSAATNYGQKKSVRLPDGTLVILNSGSRIYYPAQFGQENRKVLFKGEGFFQVAHNPSKPFLIHSGEMTTKVLGTSFNVKNFESEDEINVSVVTGKVAMETRAGHKALLEPNEMGLFQKENQEFTKLPFDPDKLTAWTRGILIFENENLQTIFHKLEKWYGVRFLIEDDVVLEGKYSGEYKQKSLELVLEGLSYTSNFSYKINHKTIIIYEKRSM